MHVVTRERRFSDTDGAAAPNLVSIASHTRSHFTRQLEQHVHETSTSTASSTAPTASVPLAAHHCTSTPDDCALAKVFRMPELLASVLGFLDTAAIMSMSTRPSVARYLIPRSCVHTCSCARNGYVLQSITCSWT